MQNAMNVSPVEIIGSRPKLALLGYEQRAGITVLHLAQLFRTSLFNYSYSEQLALT